MSWKNIKLIFMREVRDQLRDRRTLFMITILPLFLYPMLGLGVVQMMLTFSEQQRVVVILNADELPDSPAFLNNDGIHPDWYENGKKDTSRLRILAERTASALSEAAPDAVTPTGDETPEAAEAGPGRRGENRTRNFWLPPTVFTTRSKRSKINTRRRINWRTIRDVWICRI